MTMNPNWLRIAAGILLVFLCPAATDGRSYPNPDSRKEVVLEVNGFLTDWLVKRDIDAAMGHVSLSPILGACARPPDLSGKSDVSPRDFGEGIRSILKRLIELTPSKQMLNEVIAPSGASPSEAKESEPFELFSLSKNFGTARFLCKFDEDTAFRRAFANPNVWYLTFELKSAELPDLQLILAWRKEGISWKIFSIALVED